MIYFLFFILELLELVLKLYSVLKSGIELILFSLKNNLLSSNSNTE
jgi:hypothetical protein